MPQIRFDDPALDLVAHARQVAAGAAQLLPGARHDMIQAIGSEPDRDASDRTVALHYLASRGIRA